MPYVRRQAKRFASRAGKGLMRQGASYVKKRYTRPSGALKYNKLVKDAATAVSMLNAEKKSISWPVSSFAVGQVDANISGARQFDVSPIMSQGVDANTRNGNSIKLTSSFFQFQVQQQSSTVTTPLKLRVELWLVKGVPVGVIPSGATAAPITDLYDPSVFSGIIDMTSTRQQDHYSDYRLIASRNVKIAGDQVAGGDIQATTFTMPIKWNRGKGHHVRYAGTAGSAADIANGQIFMVFRTDLGNKNAATASTKDIPLTAANTGVTVKMGFKHWYYDN